MPVQHFNDDSVQLFCEVVGSGRRVDEQIGVMRIVLKTRTVNVL
jgi:hypothetical protein